MALKSAGIMKLGCIGTDIHGVKVRVNNEALLHGKDIDGVQLTTSSLFGDDVSLQTCQRYWPE
jgi:hypothetical protein